MKIADIRELYQLITANCKHYISIIESYREENLQTLFNMSIRRIEGHLLIKFRLNANERWIEVGFFDDENTDQETMTELKNSLMFYLENHNAVSKNRREHLIAQFNDASGQSQNKNTSSQVKQALPDNYFSPVNNPELRISQTQLESAGYRSVPEGLKEREKELRGQATRSFSLEDHLNKIQQEVLSEKIPSNDISDTLQEFKRFIKSTQKSFTTQT